MVGGAANEAYEAYRARGRMKDGRRFGRPADPYRPPETPAGKVNVTDPDSKNVKSPRGYVQGYNAQAVADENQVVIAAEVNADSPDFGHLEPMVNAHINRKQQPRLASAGRRRRNPEPCSLRPRLTVELPGSHDCACGRGILWSRQ